ncbi:MAG: dihydrolipoyl dehydrogenase [Phycisphaeraceae bacterium]
MSEYDLIVIGAGPGGYVAAIRAAQLGMNVACIDENSELGGTCLRVGCIPSKAMLESSERYDEAVHHLAAHGINIGSVKLDLAAMLKRKEKVVQTLTRGVASLFKKNKVTAYTGRGKLTKDRVVVVTNAKGDEQTLTAKHIILATGSTPATLPGIDFADKRIDTSTDALSYDKAPKKLAVIGAGYIGIELGSVWRRLGTEVTMIEYLDRILPGMDSELATLAHKLLKKQGLDFKLGAKVTGAKSKGKGAVVELDGGETVEADRVLVAVGRKPNTDGLGLDEAGVTLDERGRVAVDERFRTNVEGVYAIGDVIAGPMLAHKAEDEGVACVEMIATEQGHVDYNAIPAVVYTHPEIASVGRTEDQLKEQGVAYRKGTFPFLANGRARALEQTDGMVKILADDRTDRVLGVHILGPRAGDLIAECATAMAFGASSEDLVMASHAHPTLAEAVREAAMAVDDRAIHI